MHYYYDLLVNLDTCFWQFYEWEKTDNLTHLKKVLVYKVSDNDLKKFLLYDVSFEGIKGTILFVSNKNACVLEINDEGLVTGRSKLLLDDEISVIRISSSYKKDEVYYKVLEYLPKKESFRQGEVEKHFVDVEINTIKNTKNVSKCEYLYYEWFLKKGVSFEQMLKDLFNELNKGYTMKIHEIAKLIRLSYKEIS